jgi:hypothetical protein
MIRLAAILFLALSVIAYAWQLSHGTFTWTLWALLGLLAWCISEHPKAP